MQPAVEHHAPGQHPGEGQLQYEDRLDYRNGSGGQRGGLQQERDGERSDSPEPGRAVD